MVDFIKYLPPILPSYSSNIHRTQTRSPAEQFSLPIFFSNLNPISQHNDNSNINNNAKRWIGRCPGDPPRHINVSDSPYSLHRKVIYRELSRCCPTTNETSIPIKIKQQQQQQKTSSKESLKLATVTSNSILSDSRLFDALSQHVTVKAEPLRSTNSFVNSSLSSWQKYWTSTHTQRRRKEFNDSESLLYRPKRDQSIINTTHFVTIRDSSFHTTTENNSQLPLNSTPRKISSPVLSDKQDDLFSLPPLTSPRDKTPPMNQDKIQYESEIMNSDNDINTITTKIYKLPLPSNQLKTNKSTTKRRTRSKSLDKKPPLPSTLVERKEPTIYSSNTSVSRRRQQTASNKSQRSTTAIKKQQSSLSTVITTTPRSKYEHIKWDEPYVGIRFDPPTPPCSPATFTWPQNENNTPSEQNFTDKITFL